MRAAIYIRVSTEEQATEGFSIRAQKNNLVDYCRVNEYEITKIYIDDGYSAKDTNRPRLQELMDDAEKKVFDAVLVYKLDRFTRSVKDLYDLLAFLQQHGIDFISRQEKFDTTTAMGRAMIGILGVFAQFERELIAERVRFGLEQKVREGKRPGGRYPFGYDSDGELIEEEAEQIRRVRSLYMSGMSYQGVAAQMMREGYTRRTHEWTAGAVPITLENPFYAGIIRFGSKLPNGKYPQRKREEKVRVMDVPGSHESVWTVEEFEEHLARLRRRSEGGYNSKKMDYVFNGVLRCGRCGAAMYGKLTTKRSLKNGDIVRTPYYWCSRRKENKSCDMPMFRQTHVEHLIMEHIATIQSDQQRVDTKRSTLQQKDDERKREETRLRRDLDKIRARVKKWQYAFAEDLISDTDLKKRMDEEREAESSIMVKLGKLDGETEPVVADSVIHLSEIWTSLDDADKQEAVGKLFERITLHTNETNVKGVKNAYFPATVEIGYK